MKSSPVRGAAWEALIVGGGPAGLSAGIHLARAGYRVLLLERSHLGGQARRLEFIENYPGFPRGIPGEKLMRLWARQARRWGLRIRRAQVVGIARRSGIFSVRLAGGAVVTARSVINCPGAPFRKLGVRGEGRLQGRGVYHAAFEEAVEFRGRDVAVAGGGEAAVHQSVSLSRYARKVYLIYRGASLKAHRLLLRRLARSANVERLAGMEVSGLQGRRALKGLRLRHVSGKKQMIAACALFVLVGKEPARRPKGLRRGPPGFFAAGDARSGVFRQVAVAGGDGMRAAMECIRHLEGMNEV